ncbi:hypothetical protein CEXT_68171 [Caerostris extrusa]|uniref:Uncharacterized protein n=1 Tax=Caerostris extrusa TaxID=172846 RepID=A0AAV4Y8N1_CAEEX|nr:hypothetical protein CEXT_68171 [Caerostris extrusa]
MHLKRDDGDGISPENCRLFPRVVLQKFLTVSCFMSNYRAIILKTIHPSIIKTDIQNITEPTNENSIYLSPSIHSPIPNSSCPLGTRRKDTRAGRKGLRMVSHASNWRTARSIQKNDPSRGRRSAPSGHGYSTATRPLHCPIAQKQIVVHSEREGFVRNRMDECGMVKAVTYCFRISMRKSLLVMQSKECCTNQFGLIAIKNGEEITIITANPTLKDFGLFASMGNKSKLNKKEKCNPILEQLQPN